MLNINIQLFADDGNGQADPVNNSNPQQNGATSKEGGSAASGKTFSEEYVHDLREESKTYRQQVKSLESSLRKALEIGDDEDIGDVNKRIEARKNTQEKALSDALNAANSRLIKAEIKALEGYDTKLLEKVMDMSKITVDENGEVKGVKEAAEAAEKEYPAVKINNQPAKYSNGTGSAQVGSEKYSKDMLAFRAAAGLKND